MFDFISIRHDTCKQTRVGIELITKRMQEVSLCATQIQEELPSAVSQHFKVTISRISWTI